MVNLHEILVIVVYICSKFDRNVKNCSIKYQSPMKHFLVFIMLTSFYACQPKELPTELKQSEGFASMKVSHLTTKQELKEMAQKLAVQEIKIDYTSSEFFDDGKLRKLQLFVVTPDGSSGATTVDGVTLQFKYFGFLYQKDGNPTFKIGEMPL